MIYLKLFLCVSHFFVICVRSEQESSGQVSIDFFDDPEIENASNLDNIRDNTLLSNGSESKPKEPNDIETLWAQDKGDIGPSNRVGESCWCGTSTFHRTQKSTKIVGGVPSKTNEIPWRVAIYIFNKRTPRRGSMCGGTIISPNWILTAAHCTNGIRPGVHGMTAYVGAQANPVTVGSGRSVIVDRYIAHPAFSNRNLNNDIALLHLQRPLQYTSSVAPACLPYGSLSRSNFGGASVLASGWGTTRPVGVNQPNKSPAANILRKVMIPVLTTAQCSRYMRITQNQFCTYQPQKDTCQGDSGGSVDYRHSNGRYYAIGIVSHGYGCAQRNRPGVYTKVNNYLGWIQQITGETYCLS